MDCVGRRNWPDFGAYPLDQLGAQIIARRFADVERHIGVNALALDVMWHPDDCCFGDFGVENERRLNLCGAHAVAADVDDVINAACNPIIAVGVAPCAVSSEIFAGEGGEIGLEKAAVIAPDAAHLPRPASRDDEVTLGGTILEVAFAVDNLWLDAGHWLGRAAGLEVSRAWHWRDHRRACLSLPPCIDDRAATVTNNAMIPAPCLRIDRLTNSSKQFK